MVEEICTTISGESDEWRRESYEWIGEREDKEMATRQPAKQ